MTRPDPDPLRRLDINTRRLSMVVAMTHLIDLDGLERVAEQLQSPAALLAGYLPTSVQNASEWLELIQHAKAIREANPVDRDILEAVEKDFENLRGWATDSA